MKRRWGTRKTWWRSWARSGWVTRHLWRSLKALFHILIIWLHNQLMMQSRQIRLMYSTYQVWYRCSVRICSIVLIQPRTPVSFWGILIHLFIWFPETLDSDIFQYVCFVILVICLMYFTFHLWPHLQYVVFHISQTLQFPYPTLLLLSLRYSDPLLCTGTTLFPSLVYNHLYL